MNTLDILLGIISLILILWGAWQGLIKSIFNLISWFGGIFAMLWVGATFTSGPLWFPLVAGALAFIVGLLLLRTIGSLLNTIVSAIPVIGTLNWMGGGILGLVKALVFAYGILWALNRFSPDSRWESIRNTSFAYQIWKDSVMENF